MKYLTKEELYKLTTDEKQKYYDDILLLRRFACALVKDISRPALGKLENRCMGRMENYVSYENSMFVYLTNAVYRHILGKENLENARYYKNRTLDEGKRGVTIPSVLSLPALVHLKNYYHYVENKLLENPNVRFHGDKDIQDFLREARKEYAKDIHINFAFTGRTDDCAPLSVVAKPISSLDKLADGGNIKQTNNYPVFDEYTIKTMEINEYLLSRAEVLYRNPLHIKAMEEALQDERLAVVDNAGKSEAVKAFYTGTVAEVLARMKGENEKAHIVASATKRKANRSENVDNVTESQGLENSNHGGNYVLGEIKNALIERNSVVVRLADAPSSANEGVIKNSQPDLIGLKDKQIAQKLEGFSGPKAEQGVEEPKEEIKRDEKIAGEKFKLEYMLKTGRIDYDEYYEGVEALRKGEEVQPSFEEESENYSGGEQLALFDCVQEKTGEAEQNIIEDENGQIKLF